MTNQELIESAKVAMKDLWQINQGKLLEHEQSAYNCLRLFCNRLPADTTIPSTILSSIFAEVAKAEAKHPEWPTDMIHAAAIVGEESGELTRAALQWVYEDGDIIEAQKEAVQVACTAIRFLIGLAQSQYRL